MDQKFKMGNVTMTTTLLRYTGTLYSLPV